MKSLLLPLLHDFAAAVAEESTAAAADNFAATAAAAAQGFAAAAAAEDVAATAAAEDFAAADAEGSAAAAAAEVFATAGGFCRCSRQTLSFDLLVLLLRCGDLKVEVPMVNDARKKVGLLRKICGSREAAASDGCSCMHGFCCRSSSSGSFAG